MAGAPHVLEQMREANPVPSLERLAADDLGLVRDLVAGGRSGVAAPVRERPQPVRREEPPRSRWMRPAFVAGLAGVVVLGTLGVATVILGGGGDVEPAGPAPTEAPATSVPGVEAPPIPVIGPAWTPASVDDAVFGPGAVRDVITIPDGFLAVGERCEGVRNRPQSCRGSIWRSPDGAEWALVFVDPVGDPGSTEWGTTRFFDAAVTLDGYLAVGRTDHVWFNYPVFAYSTDGVAWGRFGPWHELERAFPDIVLDTNTQLSVVAADDALLLAGQSCEHVGPQAYDCRGAIWRSEDGLAWMNVLRDVPDSAFESIARVDDRYLAVGRGGVGLDLIPVGGEVVRIWSSFDGITWEDVSSDPSVFGAERSDPAAREYAQAVTGVDAGFIVAGSRLDVPEGAIWFSRDGTTWVRVSVNGVFRGGTVTGIAGSGDRIVAVGAVGTVAAAWRSDDGGFTWERMDIAPALTRSESRFLDVAIRGDFAVAGLSVGDRAAIWAVDLGAER